jgi:hypothetical protein
VAVRGVVGPLFLGHGSQKLFGWFGGVSSTMVTAIRNVPRLPRPVDHPGWALASLGAGVAGSYLADQLSDGSTRPAAAQNQSTAKSSGALVNTTQRVALQPSRTSR